MAFPLTLAACNQTPALNGPDGTDLPSTLDDALRYAFSYIAAIRDNRATVGMMAQFPCINPPPGWLTCNGSVIGRASYPDLWAFAQGSGNVVTEAVWFAGPYYGAFSSGDLASNFRIPDMRGLFTRGFSFGAAGTPDPDGNTRGIGSYQGDTVLTHTHGVTDPTHTHGVTDPTHTHGGGTTDIQGNHTHAYSATTLDTGSKASAGATTVYGIQGGTTIGAGEHNHNLNIPNAGTGISVNGASTGLSVLAAGSPEGRSRNTVLAWYIKY